MNPSSLLASPAFVFLFQWTCLLALAWVAHWILRRRQARWRLILWRSVLCFGLILPLAQLIEVPGVTIPIFADDTSVNELNSPISPIVAVKPTSGAVSAAQPVKTSVAASKITDANSSPQISSKPIPWGMIMILIWALGCICGIARLVRLNLQLIRLQKESGQPTADLHRLVTQIQVRLNVQRKVNVQISDAVVSPFVCGLLRPAIILPRTLTQNLSSSELSALLSHEIAHLRRHDLFWCVAWRWVKAVCWFHPLVWNIPAAHNLACEQEADRVASGQLGNQDSYAQMLARLALRVLALPAVETKLTVNGSSQIARRLKHLGQKGMGVWNWKYSVAAFGLAGLLFLMTAGCKFTKTPAAANNPTKVEFKKVLVEVQDEDGKPIEGATILPDGFRVNGIHGADGYGWNKKLFGSPEPAVTDPDGKAMVNYPVMGIPEEKELTGALIFSVSHPEYVTVRPQEYSVDKREKPIRLTRGMHLEVSAYFGSDHQPVTELVPILNEEVIRTNDWQKSDNGVYSFHKLSPGGHILQLMGRLPSGEIVYSKDIAFIVERGKEHSKQPDPNNPDEVIMFGYEAGKVVSMSFNMQPGIRLEGRLDDNVPRPVKNGRVLICVRPKEYPAWTNYADMDDIFKKYPNVNFWKSYRPIAEDGTFVFESIPPGGLDVIVHGDGFISQNGGDFTQRNGSKLEKVPGIAMPQPFALVAPTTKIEIVTEPAATLEVTAKTKAGKPVEGATVYVNPNVLRINGIFGNMRTSSEEPFRTMTLLTNISYSATTDKNGFAVVRNIPASDRGMDVYDPQYQVPLQEPKGWRDRHIRLTFSSGETNHYELTLEPKGADFIGSH
jgi:beta-lactamase regulating signal transducer with metallopeptidase domain